MDIGTLIPTETGTTPHEKLVLSVLFCTFSVAI